VGAGKGAGADTAAGAGTAAGAFVRPSTVSVFPGELAQAAKARLNVTLIQLWIAFMCSVSKASPRFDATSTWFLEALAELCQ
jgi:hypothetical protein